MRLFLWLCAGLLFANVLVFLWPATNTVAPHVYAHRADLNPNFLSLNKEVESRYYAAEAARLESNGGMQDNAPNQSCYRLGPFMHQANYDLAQAALINAEVEFLRSTRSSQNSEVFRVFLGPYANQAEIDDARVDLKRKKILDHFVKKEDEQSFIISLGIYTTETVANTAVELFSDTLADVKLKQEQLILPQTFWLHLTLDDGLPIRQQLSTMDWGEVAVKLGKHECLQD